jgi:murein DD-endopeptidase MepM/ murein hydrolase activator NlpD
MSLRPAGRRRGRILVAAPAAILVVAVAALLLLPGALGPGGAGQSQGIAAGTVTPGGPTATPSPPATWGPLVDAPSAAPPTASPVPGPDLSGYVWPLRKARVTLPFGRVPAKWGEWVVDGHSVHDGLDIATQCGDKVLAAHDGVVLTAGRQFDDYLGWQGDLTAYKDHMAGSWNALPIVIVIADSNGLRSIYAHESKVSVKVGQEVKAGQVIGIEGQTGHASGCHVHFGIFDPAETKTFDLNSDTRERLKLPKSETARINPLLALPYRHEIEEMRALRWNDELLWQAAHAIPPSTPTPAPATPYPW